MKTFIEFLNESPIAVLGDWDGNDKFKSVSRKRKREIDERWSLEGVLKVNDHELEIRKFEDTYIVGTWGEENSKPSFFIIVRGELLKREDIAHHTFHKNCYQMKKIYTSKEFRGEGITIAFYKWLLINRFQIVSDMVQYTGARKIYSNISKELHYKADIYDVNLGKIVATDVEIEHGEEDWEFDDELYSYDYDKSHILVILYL